MYTEFLLRKRRSYGGVSLSNLQPGHREHDLGDEMGQTMNQEGQVKGGSKQLPQRARRRSRKRYRGGQSKSTHLDPENAVPEASNGVVGIKYCGAWLASDSQYEWYSNNFKMIDLLINIDHACQSESQR